MIFLGLLTENNSVREWKFSGRLRGVGQISDHWKGRVSVSFHLNTPKCPFVQSGSVGDQLCELRVEVHVPQRDCVLWVGGVQ